jgi:hypothetical protein
LSDCGVLAVPNGKVDDSLGTTIGSSVRVTCNMGYKLIGPSQITCTIKGWNETVACQIEGIKEHIFILNVFLPEVKASNCL